jgi:hypothetical protein
VPTRTGTSPTTPAVGACDREIAQLDFLLLNLRLQRFQRRFRVRSSVSARSCSCLLIAPAAYRSRVRCACCRAKATAASRAARSASWLETAACCRRGIDLHQRRALTDAVARFDEDLRDLAVNLAAGSSSIATTSASRRTPSSLRSVASSAVASVTAVGGICGGGPLVCARLQAATASAAQSAALAVLVDDMATILSGPGKRRATALA